MYAQLKKWRQRNLVRSNIMEVVILLVIVVGSVVGGIGIGFGLFGKK